MHKICRPANGSSNSKRWPRFCTSQCLSESVNRVRSWPTLLPLIDGYVLFVLVMRSLHLLFRIEKPLLDLAIPPNFRILPRAILEPTHLQIPKILRSHLLFRLPPPFTPNIPSRARDQGYSQNPPPSDPYSNTFQISTQDHTHIPQAFKLPISTANPPNSNYCLRCPRLWHKLISH